MSKRVNPHIRLITMALLLVIWSSTTTAETIHVDPNAPGPVHDGESWPTAYNFLQDALTDPNLEPGDNIRVADGTYRPDQNAADPCGSDNVGDTFKLEDGVGLYGGYAGFGAPDPDERKVETYETILTGALNDDYNSLHVVTGTNTSATAVIDGFTITGGSATGTSGGGMYNRNASPTVVNCLFRGNSTTAYGGGMYNRDASPELIDCTFTGNWATSNDGGGLYNRSSNPKITNCTFIQNSALNHGGAIYNYDNSNPKITNCRFTGNSSTNNGGAMYNDSTDPQVENCTFSGNYANIGGAMYNSYAEPKVTNCTIAGNWAILNGGGMYSNDGTQTVTNCIFWANEDSSELVRLAQIQGGSPQVTYSCIQDDNPNDLLVPFDCLDCNNIDDNPMFVRDPNAGGDGWGVGDNDDYGDLHLLPGSPSIDASNNNVVDPNSTDLDGNPRIVDGNDDGIVVVDMGAYEFAPQPPGIPGDINLDGDVNLIDFAILSYQWLGVPGDPSADIAPPGGDGAVNSDDLLMVAQNWLAGT